MLDWCKNLHTKQEKQNELIFTVENNKIGDISQSNIVNIVKPKFLIMTSEQNRKLQHQTHRKGIKTHFGRSLKRDQEMQTIKEPVIYKRLIDNSTQTSRVKFHTLTQNNLKSQIFSRQKQQAPRPNFLTYPINIFYKPQSNQNSARERKDEEMKIQKYKETKASYCMYETKDKFSKMDNQSFNEFQHIQSYNVLNTNRSFRQKVLNNSSNQYKELVKTKSINEKNRKMVESINNHIDQEQYAEVTFSQKYKKLIRNIETQFKVSDNKKSQRKFKNTPNRKILFHDRETILSKYNNNSQNEEEDDDKSFKIQESIVCQPQIKSFFTTVTRPQFYESFTVFLAVQNMVNIVMTIKEVSMNFMNKISKEILIYKEIQERNIKMSEILKLYQTQIDKNTYIFIKQAYTETFAQYLLRKHKKLIEICLEIKIVLQYLENKQFFLIRWPKIQDFVVCYDEIKIQNVDMFEYGSKSMFTIDEALEKIKEDIIQKLL